MEGTRNLNRLNKNELYYLKLYTHNYTYNQIAEFLHIEEKQVYNLQLKTQKKLKTQNCFDTIIKAFDLGILDKYDYVNKIIKDEAQYSTLNIFKINSVRSKIDVIEYQNNIEFFIKRSRSKVVSENLKQNIKKSDFNQLETKYIKMKYIDLSIKKLSKEIKVSEKILANMETTILNKLQVNCWYNAYRKAFEIKILESVSQKDDFFKINLIESRNRVLKLIKNKNETEKMKALNVYRTLISFYNTLEYNKLHTRHLNFSYPL